MQISFSGHLEKQNGRQIVQNRAYTENRFLTSIFNISLQMKMFWNPYDLKGAMLGIDFEKKL